MSNKYAVIRCLECKGIGLVDQSDPPICKCNNIDKEGCSDCEHIQFKGKYKECPECLGIGSHWIHKKTNKKTLVWCLSK